MKQKPLQKRKKKVSLADTWGNVYARSLDNHFMGMFIGKKLPKPTKKQLKERAAQKEKEDKRRSETITITVGEYEDLVNQSYE